MKNISLNFFACIFLFLLTACEQENSLAYKKGMETKNWMKESSKLKVLATTGMIEDLVKNIGGDAVVTVALIPKDSDPHSYQLVKGDGEKFERADIIFSNGIGLEHGASLKEILKKNKKVVNLGAYLETLYPSLILEDQGVKDPHIWMDVSLFMKTIPLIKEKLQEIDPIHKEAYEKNAASFLKELEDLDKRIYNDFQAVAQEKRYLVTSHDAFNYFTRRYLKEPSEKEVSTWKKRFHAPLGLAPESEVSLNEIKEMMVYLKEHEIHVLFPESNLRKDVILKILEVGKEMGLSLKMAKDPLFADGMGPNNALTGTYKGMMDKNREVILLNWKEANE